MYLVNSRIVERTLNFSESIEYDESNRYFWNGNKVFSSMALVERF